MPDVIKCAADASVAPARAISGHVQNQLLNLGDNFGAAWFSRGTFVVFFGDELSVPSKQGVTRDDSPNREDWLSVVTPYVAEPIPRDDRLNTVSAPSK